MVTRTEWEREFKARVKVLREGLGPEMTQKTMAERLGLGEGEKAQSKYKQYEGRSMLPHYLVSKFCRICGINEGELFNIDLIDMKQKPKQAKASKHPSPV